MPILNWLTREDDIQEASKAPYRLLEEDTGLSYGDKDTENMLIQGDNLEALKALLPYYAGQVKCIFIDPPYNTQNAFPQYPDNLEHTKWLSMMYPRIEVLRQLLSEEGSIWITLDDNEAHYLKIILDEVFGRNNFVSNVIWQKRVSPANDAKYLSTDHDNLIIYAKNKASWVLNRLPRGESQNKYYKNPDNDPRGDWNSITYTGNKNKTERPNLYYAIKNPTTGKEVYPPDTLTWRYGLETHQENEKQNLLYWGKDGKSKVPRLKMFLQNAAPVVPRSVWHYSEAGSTQSAMKHQKILFKDPFPTPKPEELIERVLLISSKENDLILDSYLGSGTTAAVAHKMNRKYIGIEMGEHAKTHCQARLKKVVDGEQGGISEAVNWQGGGGFKFYTLGEAVFDDDGKIQSNIKFPALAAHIWFTETNHSFNGKPNSPVLGVHDDTAICLLYNGILGDKSVNGGNILTHKILNQLKEAAPKNFTGKWIIYGEGSRIGEARLNTENITFKQTPYDIKVR